MTPRQATPGLILAGGLSRRMGTNKALSQLGGKPLLTHVIERIKPQVSELALNAGDTWAQTFELPLVPDTKAGHAGPLAGILAGMRYFANHAAQATHILTVPADSPFFPDDLSSRLADHIMQEDAIVIAASSGHVHPVFGLWPVSIADDLEHWLADDNNRRIRSFLARHHTLGVTFAPLESETASIDPFYNINTPDELATAENFFEKHVRMSQKVFGISGWKNSGKTGLAVRIVAELTARGYRVSTIKHAHHDFDIDKVGADSWRHRQAGAHEVTIVSGTRFAIMHELRGGPEPSFADILSRIAPCDLVLIEGYKYEPVPKIEARRLEAAKTEPLAPSDPHIIAIAADHAIVDTALPVFDLDDTATIADFIERTVGLTRP